MDEPLRGEYLATQSMVFAYGSILICLHWPDQARWPLDKTLDAAHAFFAMHLRQTRATTGGIQSADEHRPKIERLEHHYASR